MRKTICVSAILATALLSGVMMSCGELFPLEPDCRIQRFEPAPLAPQWDQQLGVVIPSSIVYVDNYSQVPVFFTEYRIQYYEVDTEGEQPERAEVENLETVGLLQLFVPGVPTPEPYLPDSTSTRVTRVTACTGIQIYTADAFNWASNGTFGTLDDYNDDRDLSALVTLFGESETGEDITIWGSVPISTLLQRGG